MELLQYLFNSLFEFMNRSINLFGFNITFFGLFSFSVVGGFLGYLFRSMQD